MKKIKSFYFIKKIYSFLEERRKLDLIKYNKKIQNSMNISLINYKFLSGKYVVFMDGNNGNGKGKEYDGHTGIIIFEGEYSNRKRNGKGKEYNIYKELIFEGEYLNGKKHGKGKEYENSKNNIILLYDGEYLNGEKHGFGKEYDIYGKLYEGEYLNGKKHGKGKEYDKNGNLIYEGEYVKGKRKNDNIENKRVIMKTNARTNRLSFIGEINGNGKEYDGYDHIIFEGEYLNGKRHGKGKEYNNKGELILECEYKNGKKWNAKGYDGKGNKTYEIINGKGYAEELNYRNEIIYKGNYLNGLKHGKGEEYIYDRLFEDEKYEYISDFKGEYLYGHKIKGKEYYYGEIIFEGEYLFDKKWDGKGYESGNIVYELNNGVGTLIEYYIYPGSKKFEGELFNGIRHGKAKEYYYPFCYCHPYIDEGKYLNGQRHGVWKSENEELEFLEYNEGKLIRKINFIENYEQLIAEKDELNEKNKVKGYKNGILIYDGEYYNRSKNGKGKEYNENGILIYEGEYDHGFKNGKGKEYNKDGNLVYEGEFYYGKRDGKGKEYNEHGKIIFEGEYFTDKKWNGKEYNYDSKDGKLLSECEYLNGKNLSIP